MPCFEKQPQHLNLLKRLWTRQKRPLNKWFQKNINNMPERSMKRSLINFHPKECGTMQSIFYQTLLKPLIARYTPWGEEKKTHYKSSSKNSWRRGTFDHPNPHIHHHSSSSKRKTGNYAQYKITDS